MANIRQVAAAIVNAAKIAKGGTAGLLPVHLQWAVVRGVDTTAGTVTITLGGSAIPIPDVQYLAAYVPSAGDTVAVLHVGPDLFVVGGPASSTLGDVDAAPLGVTWPLTNSGDMDFQPNGSANKVLVLVSPGLASGLGLEIVGNASSVVLEDTAGNGIITSDTAGVHQATRIANPGGDVIFGNRNAAPADAELSAGQYAFWLDDTPGATVFHIKAKDSAGFVATAFLNL